MKTQFNSRLSYSDIFKDKPNIFTLVKKIDFYPALEFLVVINKYEHKIQKEPNSEIKFILNNWLPYSSEKIKNKIIAAYSRVGFNKQKNKIDLSNTKILNTASTLRLMELLLAKSVPQQKSLEEATGLECLFKAYLLINDEFTNRENLIFGKWFPIKNPENEIRLHLFLGLNLYAVNNEFVSKQYQAGFLKLFELEKWLRNHPDYKKLSTAYLKEIGLNSWYEYFNDIFQLLNIALGTHKFSAKIDVPYKSVSEYLSQRIEEKPTWSELINLRKNPLLKLENDEYLILHLGFLMDKFFSGLYHDLLHFSKKMEINNFHQDYSKVFLEKFLLKSALNSCFKNNYIQFSEEDIKKKGVKKIENLSLPDYYIRNGNKVMMFECKNSFLANTNKIELNFDKIEDDVVNKFYRSGGKKKALLQLINFIQNSSVGKYLFFDEIRKLLNIRYYPIIVVTDDAMVSLGVNQLLNEFFAKEKDKLEVGFRKRIFPVTIIHIDDFFYYGSDINRLFRIIAYYHDFIKKQKGVESMISFSSFLDTEHIKRKPIREKDIRHILEYSLLPTE